MSGTALSLNRSELIARLLWIFPAILLFLTIDQVNVALDLRRTLAEGTSAEAEIVGIDRTDRADITMASARLRIPLEGGDVLERELPMPITFIQELEGLKTVEVRLDAGADQEVVIAELGRAQWRLAAINSAMAFLALILVSIGVFAWNRYLKRKGDPADRIHEEAV